MKMRSRKLTLFWLNRHVCFITERPRTPDNLKSVLDVRYTKHVRFERHRHRNSTYRTNRLTDERTNGETGGQTDKPTGRRTNRRADGQTDKQIDRQMDSQTNQRADWQTDGHIDIHWDKPTDRQTDKWTNRRHRRTIFKSVYIPFCHLVPFPQKYINNPSAFHLKIWMLLQLLS